MVALASAILPGLVWARPLGALAFVLPPLVWLLLRWSARPTEAVTGTARLWRELGDRSPRTRTFERRRLPLWAWFVVAALGAGALALVGPRRADPPAPRLWRVVVDSSPSMDLPDPTGKRRCDVGIEGARQALARAARAADRVLWSSPGRPDLELAPGEAPPETWRAPLGWPAPAPDFGALDRAGVLFVTDDLPRPAPRHAGFVLTGARLAPGPVGRVEGRALHFDGERLVVGDEPAAPVFVFVEHAPGFGIPAPFERLLGAWLAARGYLRATPAQRAEALLVLSFEGQTAGARRVEVGRDGWWSLATISSSGLAPANDGLPETVWLEAPAGPALVRAAPGRVRLALLDLEPPQGDPASFAVSFGTLLDDCTRPAAKVVSLAERSLVSEPAERAPRAEEDDRPSGQGPWHSSAVDAWLASAAGVLCLAALSLRRG